MAEAAQRNEVTRREFAPQTEHDIVEARMANIIAFENGLGLEAREKWLRFYRQYRGFRQFADEWTRSTSENDRDEVIYDAKKHWGAHLHIPLSFRTIETMVPRAIAHRPRMLYLPREERWEKNVQNVRLLIDSQQENIDIDLPYQGVMRSGQTYGLGAGKCYWRQEQTMRRQLRRRVFLPGKWVPSEKLTPVTTFDDPMFEDIDIFDLGWDPYGYDPRTCAWMYHRVWMSKEAVLKRLQMGVWNTETAQGLSEDDIKAGGMGAGQKYDEIWQDRMSLSGFNIQNARTNGDMPIEVFEWHDGHQVQTILNRQFLVQNTESPCLGEMPFQIYRPTPLQHQFCGIGALEPLEHLQHELDTLRSQRRDAATIALAAGYAFDESAVDEESIEFGPQALIPVRNMQPDQAILPLRRQEVPGSGYQEEQVIRTDFDVVSGIQDGLDNSPGGSAGTATEAQLVQAALGRRVALASRRFELEVVRPSARAFLYLNQRMILEKRGSIRQPGDGMDETQAAQAGRWQWYEIGPAQLQGEYTIIPEGGSMAARNVPQDRQDAIQIMSLFGQNPHVDPRRPLMRALQLFEVKDPEAWLKQEAPPIPPAALDVLKAMGVKPELIDFAVAQAQMQQPMLGPDQQQGPTTQDVAAMMGGTPEGAAA